MPTLLLSHIRFAIRQCTLSIFVLLAIPAHVNAATGATGATARMLAQPLLVAFQHSVIDSGALGAQSRDSLSCVAALPIDSFADLIQNALSQGLSNTDLQTSDTYFSRPVFSTEIPYLLAYLQGVTLSTTKFPRPPLSETDQRVETDLLHHDILNKLMTAYYFKKPQVFAAFNARSKNLLMQCAIRPNDQHTHLRVLA
jgi:hypothetical protein